MQHLSLHIDESNLFIRRKSKTLIIKHEDFERYKNTLSDMDLFVGICF